MVFLRKIKGSLTPLWWTVWTQSILDLEGTLFIVLPQPLSPPFREKEEDTKARRRVEGTQPPQPSKPVTAQALPSQETATASFSPGLHLPSLPLSVSQKPEVSPHLCPQSPFLLPLGICRGVCMCVCVSLPHFSGHLKCMCVRACVCVSWFS